MRYSENSQRQNVLFQALGATTLPEVEQAEQGLRNWISEHPDDVGIVEAFEQLSLMRDITTN